RLRVPKGETIALIGGNVSVDRGTLFAPGGRVELGGLAGTGTVGLNADGGLDFPTGVALADVSLLNGAVVNVLADGGGNININAQNIELLGSGTRLTTGIATNAGTPDARAGDITLNATGATTLESSRIENNVKRNATGDGGDIRITTGSLSLLNGAQLDSGTGRFGRGNAGNIRIIARDTVRFDGVRVIGGEKIPSSARSPVAEKAAGHAGDISIEAESFFMTNGGEIRTETAGVGNAGNIRIIARDTVKFDGVEPASNFSSIVFSRVRKEAVGRGGDVYISARSFAITNGAQIISETRGIGDAGNITIVALEGVLLSGVGGRSPASAAIISSAQDKAKGNGGNIRIEAEAGSIFVANGAFIDAATNASGSNARGNAGNITIIARDTVSIDGVDRNRTSKITSPVGRRAQGNGGNISIEANSVSLTNGGQLNVDTEGLGNAGNIRIIARATVSIDGVTSNKSPSLISSSVGTRTPGNGGNISIEANSVSLTNGGQLNVDTEGLGNAGNIRIIATDTVSFDGAVRVGGNRISSIVFSRVRPNGVGRGGDVYIAGRSVSLTDGAQIISETRGIGDAGNIAIIARDGVLVDGVSRVDLDTPSALISSTQKYATGNGGNINIKVETGSLFVTNGGFVDTATHGQGNSGSINIFAGDVVLVAGVGKNDYPSGLYANAFETSSGNGGDLRITAGQLIVRDGAEVTVNNQGTGNAGTLSVDANSIFLDNQGKLSASTASGEGGNVNLQVQDLILMRRNSLISAQAGNNGNGGNIAINAPFLVAVPKENSDIIANAFQGRGGNINITAQGIYGLEYRPQLTTLSDINASSEFGVDGTVEINTLGVDPSQGLVQLPSEPANVEVTEGCEESGKQGSVEFFNIGRGGLALNPYEPLSNSEIWEDVPLPTQMAENSAGPARTSTPPATPPKRIVEAQGWLIDEKGEVALVAEMPSPQFSNRCRLR
ncbi:MAG: S-layer family protein, partial [Cyanobacteriota bacterium]